MEKPSIDENKSLNIGGITIVILSIFFVYAFLANSWICDDAFITFRVVDNLLNGYGPVWNVAERVQVFTNPLWMFFMAAWSLIIPEIFYAAIIAAMVTCVAMLVLVLRDLRDPLRMLFFFALIISSKAFMDYTSSGLENPLTFFFVAIFFIKYFNDSEAGKELQPGDVYFYLLAASLSFFNRMDTILLYAVPLIHVLVIAIRRYKYAVIKYFLLGTLPASLWLLFATVYYGFPLPNTFYAKVATGMPGSVVFKQGIAYLFNNINFDPITLTAVALAVGLAFFFRRAFLILPSLSMLLYLLYVVRVGGDFMAGRFLAAPFLLAALMLVHLLRDKRLVFGGLAFVVLYTFFAPVAPIKTGPNYDQAWNWRIQNGIHDERGAYHKGTNVLFYDPFKRVRDRDWRVNGHVGVSLRASGKKVYLAHDIGWVGYHAGPEVFVIDPFALADPLLARTPAPGSFLFDFWIGNVKRDIPKGYIESCRQDKNLIADPGLHEYYEGLRRITRGPIFDWQRFVDIVRYNIGDRRYSGYRHTGPRGLMAAPKASHERFQTYVGVRRAEAGTLTSNGEEGFLQMGPYIPLEKGSYAVEWYGAVESAGSGQIGFVDVCHRNGLEVVKRMDLGSLEAGQDSVLLARIEFELDRDIEDIEYRFYVRKGVRVRLERISLFRLADGDGK